MEENKRDTRDQSMEQESKPKRNPYCSRCRNHGKSAQVKGHKRHCEYRDCQCEGCKLVECRQIVSAAQIKRRRYQKQDEECGRRIEISPPVLTREPNNDPAALIAKTLIGSAQAINHHVQLGRPGQQPGANLHPFQAGANCAGPHSGPSQPFAASSPVSSHYHNHPLSAHSILSLNQRDPHQNLEAQPHSNLQHSGQQPSGPQHPLQAGSAALSNALHLFHFPSSALSVAAAASLGPHQLRASPLQVSAASSPPLPSVCEQVNLVEEFYEDFGPLAVYAWLRSEHFDLQKVRNLIELSRAPFGELLQITGHSPLDLTSPIVD